MYEVIAAPPFTTGGVKLTFARAFPGVAVTPVGASGATATKPGMTGFDGFDGWLVPIAFVAVTVKV